MNTILSCLCEKVLHETNELQIEYSTAGVIPLLKTWVVYYAGRGRDVVKIRT
jgi:hypothetical protein